MTLVMKKYSYICINTRVNSTPLQPYNLTLYRVIAFFCNVCVMFTKTNLTHLDEVI